MYMMSQANSLEDLLIARFLLGVAEGNMWPVSTALTNRWFPAGEHSRVQAFWITGLVVGTAIGVPIITTLDAGQQLARDDGRPGSILTHSTFEFRLCRQSAQ